MIQSPNLAAAPFTQDREKWIDVARGIGIVLVVFGHVWRGLSHAGLLADASAFKLVDDAVYLFHMPLFFVISGMLFAPGVRSRGVWGSFVRRLFTLAYPYLLWSYLNLSLKYSADDYVSSSITMNQVIHFYYPPVMQFWFIFQLFFIQTILSFSFLSRRHAFKVVLGLACLAILVDRIPGATAWLPDAAVPLLPNLAIFVLGMAIGNGTLVLPKTTPRSLLAAGAAFAAAQVAHVLLPPAAGNAVEPLLAVICVLAVLHASTSLAALRGPLASRIIDVAAAFGIASLAIYVAHVMFTAGMRIALEALGGTNLALHCVLGVAAGLVGPYALYYAARSFGVLWLAGFGAAPPLAWSGRRNVPIGPQAPIGQIGAETKEAVRKPR